MNSRDAVIDWIGRHPERLERGLVLLDRRLLLDEGAVADLLLRDTLGYPVVVLFGKGDIGAELVRMAAIVPALARGRHLLTRLFGEGGLDASLRPRFVLIAPRFPDDARERLSLLGGVEVAAFESRVVTTEDGAPLVDLAPFARTAGPAAVVHLDETPPSPPATTTGALAAAPAAGRPTADGAPQAAAGPALARDYFIRVRQAIRDLAGEISENAVDGRVEYTVAGQPLATLLLDGQGLRLTLGDAGAAPRAVGDEASFNEALSAVFELYFHERREEFAPE